MPTASVALDGFDPDLLRYVIVLFVGLALGGATVWAACARELQEHRDAVARLAAILEAAREARATAKGRRSVVCSPVEVPND
jgi:hypothetical protein